MVLCYYQTTARRLAPRRPRCLRPCAADLLILGALAMDPASLHCQEALEAEGASRVEPHCAAQDDAAGKRNAMHMHATAFKSSEGQQTEDCRS